MYKIAVERPAVIVLAGGRGTRIDQFLGDNPKPLLEVSGKPFMYWILTHLRSIGFNNFFIAAGFRSEKIRVYIRDDAQSSKDCLLIEEHRRLGTGGAILNVLKNMRHDGVNEIVITNGDSLLVDEMEDFNSLSSDVDAVIFGKVMDDASRFGTMECDSRQNLLSFQEKKKSKGIINTGVYMIRKEILLNFSEYTNNNFSLETDFFPWMLKMGYKITVRISDGAFIDIGTPESYLQADEFIKQNLKT